MQSLENIEQASDDLGVMTGHGWVPKVAHEGIDGHCRVVVFTAGNEPSCW